ncbi:MAG: aminotransferase class I/II-fold pyridoxal phosphate-dependent enzyme [Bacteroidota bacterium]
MTKPASNLSARGTSLATNPARIDFEIFMEASQNLYCPEHNPTGAFPLNVAENHLSAPVIKEQLMAVLRENDIPDWVLGYTSLLGHPEVREEIARFMEQQLCGCPIDPDTIGLSAGASATIEVSSFVLANPGDVVVIPAPSYPMYTNDLGLRSGMQRYDLQTHYELEEIGASAPVTVEHLNRALADLNAQEQTFKLLLITSPDNPTGCRYTEAQLRELAHWCIQHQVHMVVNEIYGLSLIGEEENGELSYCSFAKIMHDLQCDYLHLWYAFSKDFAMSGLRVGVVHSLNQAFMTGMANANVPHLVSNLTQWAIAELLKKPAFLKPYVINNKARINQSYQLVVKTLRQLSIPFVPAKGSFFIWADFSKYLADDTDKAEEQLWLAIYRNTGVLLTPGMGFMHQKQGLFRIVFTAVPFAHLQVAMERMSNYLIERQA